MEDNLLSQRPWLQCAVAAMGLVALLATQIATAWAISGLLLT